MKWMTTFEGAQVMAYREWAYLAPEVRAKKVPWVTRATFGESFFYGIDDAKD